MPDNRQKEYWNESVYEPLIEKALKYVPTGKALDIGSGQGRDSLFLASQGFQVTALDNDPVHQRSLQSKARQQALTINLIMGAILNYETANTFDIIVCDMVLHFFNREQIKSTILKMQSWTKSGGVNVVVAYSDKNPEGKRPYLFKHNELKDFYKGWSIRDYEEKPTPWFQLPGEPVPRRNQAVYLLAQR